MDGESSRPWRSEWLDVLASRCQTLAGGAHDLLAPAFTDTLRTLVSGLPRDLTMAERLVTRSRLTTVLARTMQTCRIDRREEVLSIFFAWAAVDIASSTWADDAARFVEACARATQRLGPKTSAASSSHDRVAAALRMIEAEFADSDLSLDRVAAHAGISVWHAARLLKRVTGSGFTTHLHRARIAAAERLLSDRSLCIKEIAAAVGYSTSSQFCAYFKRHVGITATRYRMTIASHRIAG
jgi:AraC-like DNA-binding protein